MGRETDVSRVLTSQVVVPAGATLAVLVTQLPSESALTLKYVSGGTAYILGFTAGMSLTAAELATGASTGYVLGSTEVLSFGGAAQFYVGSLGATSILHVMRGLSGA